MVDHHGKEVIYVMFVNEDGQGQGIWSLIATRPSTARTGRRRLRYKRGRRGTLERGTTSNWPGCPFHSDSHPLEPAVIADTALWRCPKTAEPVGAIGELR